jgi:hypothetical protein
MNIAEQCLANVDKRIIEIVQGYIEAYKAYPNSEAFEAILSNLPQGLQLTAGLTTNYLQLKTIYFQRRNHKLSFWNTIFVEWVNNLPYFADLVIQEH